MQSKTGCLKCRRHRSRAFLYTYIFIWVMCDWNSLCFVFVSSKFLFDSYSHRKRETERKRKESINFLSDTPAPIRNCIIKSNKTRTSQRDNTNTHTLIRLKRRRKKTNSIHCQLNVKYTRIWLPPAILCCGAMVCQNISDRLDFELTLNTYIQQQQMCAFKKSTRSSIENAKQCDSKQLKPE